MLTVKNHGVAQDGSLSFEYHVIDIFEVVY